MGRVRDSLVSRPVRTHSSQAQPVAPQLKLTIDLKSVVRSHARVRIVMGEKNSALNAFCLSDQDGFSIGLSVSERGFI